jgi:hypothetical protein
MAIPRLRNHNVLTNRMATVGENAAADYCRGLLVGDTVCVILETIELL